MYPIFTKLGLDSCWLKLKKHQDVLHWNDKGELLYENKPTPGFHVVDLVNDTLRHRKGLEPVGWSVFARGLGRMNVPKNLVRSPLRQSAIRELKARVRGRPQKGLRVGYPTCDVVFCQKAEAQSRESSASRCSMVTIIIMTRDFFLL